MYILKKEIIPKNTNLDEMYYINSLTFLCDRHRQDSRKNANIFKMTEE